MKNFKVMLLALVAVLGLSSCLGESDPNVTGREIVKVETMYGFSFKSASGYVINPLNPMDVMNLTGPFAQIVYQYNRDEVTTPITKVNATILAAEDIPQMHVSYEGELEENAPMASIMQAASAGVMFFDKDNIFLPLSFYYKPSSDQNIQNAEVKSHHFELFQIDNDDANADNITLRLVHHVDNTDINKERKSVGTLLNHVNLVSILGGRIPEKIIIKFTKAGNDATMENASKELGSFEIDYKKIYEAYYKPKN